MIRTGAFFLMLAAAALASAKSYTVNLLSPAMFGGVELQPGEYKMEVNDQTAVIKKGSVRGESKVKVEDGTAKYDQTTVRFDNAGGKMKIQEIRIGGTKTKLVFAM